MAKITEEATKESIGSLVIRMLMLDVSLRTRHYIFATLMGILALSFTASIILERFNI